MVVCFFISAVLLHKLWRCLLEHREAMAEIEARRETARALMAAPEEAHRTQLAQELLDAYSEAGEGLRNDENGSLERWA